MVTADNLKMQFSSRVQTTRTLQVKEGFCFTISIASLALPHNSHPLSFF